MGTTQLRAELFREMNPLLDSEVMLRKTIDFIRSLYAAEQTQAKQQTLDKIDHSFGQLRQMQDGQLKGIKAEDLLVATDGADITLVTIYDKSDQESISNKELRHLMKKNGLE